MAEHGDGYPATKQAARAWVRQHWQDRMRSADVPDVPLDGMGDLIANVWAEEGRKLADRLEPRKHKEPTHAR